VRSAIVSDLAMDFVPTPMFDSVLTVIKKSMASKVERDFIIPVVTGMMGVGKTRFGQELCRSLASNRVVTGFLNSPDQLRPGEPAIAEQCLAEALLRAFWPSRPALPMNIQFTLSDVIDKLRADFGCEDIAVVLQIDEYSRNVPGVNGVLMGCVGALTGRDTFHVVPILTGVRPMADVAPRLFGTKYLFDRFTLAPIGVDSLATREAFAKAIKMTSTTWGPHLETLLTVCGGYPASIVALVDVLKGLQEKKFSELQQRGVLPPDDAEAVYKGVLGKVDDRYKEARWFEVFGSAANMDSIDKEKRQVTDRTRRLLVRILLFALGDVPVTRNQIVHPDKPNYSFAALEQVGLVTLSRSGNGHADEAPNEVEECRLSLPLLAMSVMNGYLKVVEWGILDNPFSVGFAIHEKLAMASLAVRVWAWREARGVGAKCTLSELRPGATVVGLAGGDELSIKLPASVRCEQLAFKIESGKLCTGLDGTGPTLSSDDGTLVMMAQNERGIDGCAVFSGTWKGEDVVVCWLSQSKSLELTTAQPDSVVTNDVVKKIADVEGHLVKAWLQGRAGEKDKPVLFVYDVFSDRAPGAKFAANGLELPSASRTLGRKGAVIVATTRENMAAAVGSALGIRASLKRAADKPPVGEASKEKKRGLVGRRGGSAA
jgi:hypothetical protein